MAMAMTALDGSFARCALNNGRAGVVRELTPACKSVQLTLSSDLLSSDLTVVWCGVGAACGAGCRCGACVPRAPGVLVNHPKIRSFEGTERPRFFFRAFFFI